ncbi:CHC2 zinc finger domain-containing protein [Paraburkholderia sp. A1RI-2L]|uniref:CHC2 zinc finger domain-containing protein n=1 Tax=Paraburkholderia sp. A1RI-2L TaxID=3028367 RepID=UPI003B7B71B0
MPRIPHDELERLKREVSLVRLIESQGHELKKRGRDWVMRCVFHEEDTPSLSVSEAKNVWHCFGCGASGTVLDWVMKTQGVSLPHAVQLLRNDAPLDGAARVGVARSHVRHLPSLAADADEASLLREVADAYHGTLKQSPEALGYLTQRGLVHGELVDTFRLGYANKSLTYRLPPGHSKEGREVREKLQRVGVYRASGHEHLNGCLVVPVLELETGAVRQMYGRRIVANHKIAAGQPKHLYLSLPLAGVWNEAALVASREVIVCEALIDAMTFWCAGYRNVIAAYGVNGFTQDHWAALKRHGTRAVWIAYDRDDAGNTAAETLGTELREAGMETWRVLLPRGMDVNEYARKVTPAQKSLGALLHQAEWIGKGKRPAIAAPVEPVVIQEAKETEPSPSLAAIAAVEAPEAPAVARVASEETPPAPADEPDVKQTEGGELLFTFGERIWRVRGWQKNLGPEQMRVNAQVRRGDAYHVDTLDVYSAKARALYLKSAAVELGSQEDTLKRDLGRVLLKLEALQDEAIRATLAPKEGPAVELDALEHAAALDWLKAPDLVARLEADMARCGVVGEATNLLAGYMAAVSRKLDAPLAVLNPYAEQLTFMDGKTRTRRDHMKYLTLIRAIALLHQYQREHKTLTHRGEALTYIEVTKADIALANRIAHEVLGRTLDELPPQTRRLLGLMQAWVNGRCVATAQKQNEFRFTRRDVREATSWGDTQLKVHLARLVELEYVIAHRGLRGLTHEYELRYDGADDGKPHLMGLLDAQILDNDANRSGLNTDRSGSGRPLVGGRSVGGRGIETSRKAMPDKADVENAAADGKKAVYREKNNPPERHRTDARIAEDAR